jgi:ketosteroid isomerase-like protein
MSRGNAQPVRLKLSPRRRSTRTFEERLVLRHPWFANALARMIALRPPKSRLRRALLSRTVQNGLAAYDRGDSEAIILAFDPDAEFLAPPDHGPEGVLGFRPSYRGRDGYREFDADWRGSWEALRVEPQELIDLGDRLLLLASMTALGRGSGVSISQDVAILQTLNSAGKIVREQRFFDHSEALKAVGLAE